MTIFTLALTLFFLAAGFGLGRLARHTRILNQMEDRDLADANRLILDVLTTMARRAAARGHRRKLEDALSLVATISPQAAEQIRAELCSKEEAP